ncbi:hypothetical protein Lqui_0054 [Legionella quinlivanii]|uniref:Uncharacterized protein n=1 Tax=Legionella quinlivanii TaxID=45073 RepID=A0A0W0Y841_9GAMM|nr:N-acetylmuramoyl-L-alanine amidase [Legionella quinlivanii]KTD53099.1 hypothetical protein Lqui_0054 [Legionella quinlivanii]SEG17484.1 hypothetical protein SAMN02746093_02097 [Legionella quinlivanii DSM 21216]STY10480.1 Uncharacterised protein [Legionella quinlivanii]
MNGVTRPATRQMDNYGSDVQDAFKKAEDQFFASGKPYRKDEVINLISNTGYFKVDIYEYTPVDIHYVVFFFNKKNYEATGKAEVFECHGTIARSYIEWHRNLPNINNFPIDNDRRMKTDADSVISIQSESALVWDSRTNGVTQRKYASHIPENENRLVAFTEEYAISNNDILFKNWKAATLQSISSRSVGRPSQILLHETAGMEMDSTAVFNVPAHFCVANVKDNKGTIYQMADIAGNVPHGEITNSRAIGIEFVNAPFDIWKQVKDPVTGQARDELPRTRSNFGLKDSVKGIYVESNKIPIRDPVISKNVQFIPLEFSDSTASEFFELKIPEASLINKSALQTHQINGRNILALNDGVASIKYCKPVKFENLRHLIILLSDNSLIKEALPEDLGIWKSIHAANGKLFYFYQRMFSETTTTSVVAGKTIKKITMNFPINLTNPAIFSHGHIGHHADGFLQGIYLYLRMFESLNAQRSLQAIIYFLTSEKTDAEKNPLELTEVMTVTRTSELVNGSERNIEVKFTPAASPATIRITNFLEIDLQGVDRKYPVNNSN